MDIKKAFQLLMIQEGGASTTNLKNDKGGLTKYGITKAAHPNLDIVNLTEEQAADIYNNEYWTPTKCSSLKTELQYIHFSCSVNCGTTSANKILQRAARVNPDGIIGDKTIQASQSISIQDYAIEWATHYKAIIESDPTQVVFQKGWNYRIQTILDWYKVNKLL